MADGKVGGGVKFTTTSMLNPDFALTRFKFEALNPF